MVGISGKIIARISGNAAAEMGGDVNLFRSKMRLMLLLALLSCHLSVSSAINDADLDGLDTLQAPIGEGDGATTTESKEERDETQKLEKGATTATDSIVISQGDGGTPDLAAQEDRRGKQYRLPPFSDDVRGFRRPIQDDRRRYGLDRRGPPPRGIATRRKGPNPLFDPDDYPLPPPPRRNMGNRRMDEGEDIPTRKRVKIDLRRTLTPRLRDEGISLDMRDEEGALSPSGSNYYEWESRKVGEEPIAFTPHIRLDSMDIPRRSKGPTVINATRESPWMPAGKGIMEQSPTAHPPPHRIMVTPPRLLVTPKYVNSDDLPRRPGLAGPSSPSPDNSKLHTEYFSLPKAVSEGQRTPSKIPVLVKKLAKRPVKRNKQSFEPPLPPPPPPPFVPKVKLDIKSKSDHCANSDIDCGSDKNDAEDGSVVRGKAKKLLDFLRGEVWVIPVLVFALALAAFLLVFEIFLISKVRILKTTISIIAIIRNLFTFSGCGFNSLKASLVSRPNANAWPLDVLRHDRFVGAEAYAATLRRFSSRHWSQLLRRLRHLVGQTRLSNFT